MSTGLWINRHLLKTGGDYHLGLLPHTSSPHPFQLRPPVSDLISALLISGLEVLTEVCVRKVPGES